MTDEAEGSTPDQAQKNGTQGMQIYCGVQNPDYPGRYCTKMLNPDGTHVNGGATHNDGIYSWGGNQ